jgi:hypothetical protein
VVGRDGKRFHLLPGFDNVAGFDQHGIPDPGPSGASDIFGAVSHHCGQRKVDAVFLLGAFNHTRGGFAADAFFLRGVRAVKNIMDTAAPVPDFRCHGSMNGVQGFLGDQAAVKGGLIGNDNGFDIVLGQLLNGRQTAGQKFEFCQRFDIGR